MNIAILLSGGTGSRVGSDIPKQYIKVNEKMILSYSAQTIFEHQMIDAMVIVADKIYHNVITTEIAPLANGKKMVFANPGLNRQLSIVSGLEAARELIMQNASSIGDDDTVFIHDGARPLLTMEMITACFEELTGHDGVLPVLPMKDTVYQSHDGKVINNLLNRSEIFAGQAPELFKLNKYYEANMALMPDAILNINGSTEPAVMAGMDIAMIPGDEGNYKITTKADLEKFKQGMMRLEN